MSELIDNVSRSKKDLLKHLILQLHVGAAPQQVQRQLVRLLGQVSYGLVVEVEQELIANGLPPAEVSRLCHLHGAALEGALDLSAAKVAPPGHPAQVFQAENAALVREAAAALEECDDVAALADDAPAGASEAVLALRARVNLLADVDKHYLRKEHLLFPYLEKHGITAPPKVMWTKHDEARALLRAASEGLSAARTGAEAKACLASAVRPAVEAVRDMTSREENILLPMSLDTLDELEWWEVARQSDDYGFCLVEPEAAWRPASAPAPSAGAESPDRLRLPTGSFDLKELEAILNALPFDATFVDADDRVRYFTNGAERVFSRSRAVLGRAVQMCHPPSSVDTVDRILRAFRAGEKDRAAFWIQLGGKFVHIEYRALRAADGAYLGCLEVTQDLTEKRALQGEQRLLAWAGEEAVPAPPCASPPAAGSSPGPTAAPPRATPRWAVGAVPARSFDARPVLARGEHPVEQVMGDLAGLAPGQIYELVTPFVPTPLVEKALANGIEAHSAVGEGGVVRTLFRRSGG